MGQNKEVLQSKEGRGSLNNPDRGIVVAAAISDQGAIALHSKFSYHLSSYSFMSEELVDKEEPLS